MGIAGWTGAKTPSYVFEQRVYSMVENITALYSSSSLSRRPPGKSAPGALHNLLCYTHCQTYKSVSVICVISYRYVLRLYHFSSWFWVTCTEYLSFIPYGLVTRLQEHRGDVRAHKTSNSLVMHINERDHLPHCNKPPKYPWIWCLNSMYISQLQLKKR